MTDVQTAAIARKVARFPTSYDGSARAIKLTPNARYTTEYDFYPLSLCSTTTTASVAGANRSKVDFDLEIDGNKLNYDNKLDTYLCGDMTFPFSFPIGTFLPRGTVLQIVGGNGGTSDDYFVMAGFLPITSTVNEYGERMPYFYTTTFTDCAASNTYDYAVQIRRGKVFYMTAMIAIQRVVDTAAVLYYAEAASGTIDILINNFPISTAALDMNMMFGTPQYPRKLGAPIRVGENGTILAKISTPAYGDAFARDIKLYYIGYHSGK